MPNAERAVTMLASFDCVGFLSSFVNQPCVFMSVVLFVQCQKVLEHIVVSDIFVLASPTSL